MSKHKLILPVLFFLLSIPFSQVERTNAAERPNLISIVTDDQGRWAMGLYGNKQIHTPYMDQIGREGAVFTNAFVATPVCSPSRATFLSGRYPSEHKITDYISPDEAPKRFRTHCPDMATGFAEKWIPDCTDRKMASW